MLTVDEAVDMLEIMGCSEDPVYYLGTETTPRDLTHYYGSENARHMRIKFYGCRGAGSRKSSGTLFTLILDRLRDHATPPIREKKYTKQGAD